MAGPGAHASAERHRHELFDELARRGRDVQPRRRPRPDLSAPTHFASRGARGPAAAQRRGLHRPSARRRADPRRAARRRSRRSPPRCSTTSSRTRTTTIEEVRAEFGDEVGQLVEGVTKLTRIHFQSREQAQAENYRKMIAGDGAGHARHPDQARRPPPQHADDRVPGQAEADPEGARDARGLRAARAPPRYPHDQVGARGPRVRRRSTRASTPRSRRWSTSAAPTARSTSPRRARSWSASSRRWASRPRSPGARSTSTPSTRRWRSAARSSTRSTT